MDCKKVGELIKKLRVEKNLSQNQLANKLSISGKTVSKWERGMGFPDVSLLKELSGCLDVDMQAILEGELKSADALSGNLKKCKFYLCKECGNIVTTLGEADINCCGRKLSALQAQNADEGHIFKIQSVEDQLFISSCHPMEKAHSVTAAYLISQDKLQCIKLYPQQNAEARFFKMPYSALYFICSNHGLFFQKL